MRPSVSVVGDALLDVHVAPQGAMRPGEDVPAAIRARPGGQGANLAVRLARRGVPVTLTCTLADDAAGGILRAALEAEGVVLDAIAAEASGAVVALLDGAGERTMLSQRVPFAAAAGERLAAEGWLVISGYLLLEPDGTALARSAATLRGPRTLVGCAVPDHLVDSWRSAATVLAADLVVMNAGEAERLGIDGGHGRVVTDAGGATAVVGTATATVHAPIGPPAVDTTGAGDAFAAALVAGLLDAGWPPPHTALHKALEGAAELAGAVARVRGAQARVGLEDRT